MEQLQSHTSIWLTASSNIVKYLRISSYIRTPFLIYDFATTPFWNSLKVWGKFYFLFYRAAQYQCWSIRQNYAELKKKFKRLYSVYSTCDILFSCPLKTQNATKLCKVNCFFYITLQSKTKGHCIFISKFKWKSFSIFYSYSYTHT